ncbi:hypothetical protein DNTS_001771, partial [Danionella cerebrum]
MTDLGDSELASSNGASHITGDKYACLEELERINKEIEAVRSEVEKEQKRLSQYQTSQSLVQAENLDLSTEKYMRRTNSKPKDHNANHLKCANPSSASGCKYVVDRARPKTDLEYDPCSNFSADLLTGSSTETKQKSSEKETGHKNNQRGKKFQSQSQSQSDDSDNVLIIDIPSSSANQGIQKTRHKVKTVTKPMGLPERNDAVKNAVCFPDQRKSSQHKEEISDHLASNEVKRAECPKKERTQVKPVIKQEHESSEGELIIDVSPYEDKLEKPCGATTVQPCNPPKVCSGAVALPEDAEEPVGEWKNKPVTSPVTKPSLEDLREAPGSINLKLETFIEKQETVQNIELVLDDISTCLNNMRNESEKIKCIQDVSILPVQSVHREQISSQSTAQVPKTTLWLDPLSDSFSCSSQKSQAESFKKIHHEQIVQQNAVSTQPIPSSHKTGELSIPKTSLSVSQKIPVDYLGQNTLPYASGIYPGVVSAPSSVPNNLVTAVQYIQKQPPSNASFPVTSDLPTPSKTSANMGGNINKTIVIDSSSDEDLRYSDLDLSETDPMEECYKIFMEANQKEATVEPCDPPEEPLESQATGLKSAAAAAEAAAALKRRVAHVAKFESSSKSQPQILVPLQEGPSQLSVSSRAQLCQRRAAILSSAVKVCQAPVVSSAPRKSYTTSVIHPTCVNIIPMGATLQLGSNVHFIVPEANCALPLTLIPTTMPVHRQTLHPPPVQISQASHTPHPPNYTPAKAMGVKRKAKVRPEVGAKVPHDVRQRYVNLFVEEFLKSSVTVQDAFEKALAEEKTVYDRSINKLKYLSIAVNALKRLKNQNILPAKGPSEGDQHVSRGNVPLNTQALQGPGDVMLYEQLKEHILSEELLQVNNFPRKHPDKADFAIQYGDTKKSITDPLKRICCRCGTTFSVDQSGKHTRKEECNYHFGKVIENRVPGGVETRYSCCENAVGSPGCQVFNLHVHDAVSLQGFESSLPQSVVGKSCPGVFAVDTQTCYTTQGLELVRVTVVNSSLQVVFDSFVKPDKDVIDYNTRFSGISEADVKSSSSSLCDVHTVLLSFINADTILIGHGLENDLAALKIIHSTVIDTSVVFPHRLGLPHKRDLNSLTADYLRRIIQESVVGHDTREDATACMELMLWRVKEDSKVKRWEEFKVVQ